MTQTQDPITPKLPRLTTTTSILTWGNLSWLWFAYLVGAVLLGAILGGQYRRGGTFDVSVWENIGVGVHAWVIFAAGVMTVPVFGPMLIGNGVTRGQLSVSAMATAAVLAVIGTTVTVIGFLVERVVYRRAGWEHLLHNGEVAGDAAAIGRAIIVTPLLLAAYYVSGWIVGTAFYRFWWRAGIALIVPGLLPLLIVNVLLGGPNNPVAGARFIERALDPVAGLALPVALPGALAVIVVACLAARHFTRAVPLR